MRTSSTTAPGPGTAPRRAPMTERLTAWFNDPGDPSWVRPAPTRAQQRNDVLGTAVFLAVGLFSAVLARSYLGLPDSEQPWQMYLAVAVLILPLAVRRRYPIAVLVISSVLFFAFYQVSLAAATLVAYQIAYFAALYAAVAWARHRAAMVIALAAVLAGMGLWIIVDLTLVNAYAELLENLGPVDGPVPQLLAYQLYSSLMNIAYFGGAVLAGRASWRSALQRHRLAAQTERIREQSAELARRAVVDERLRIARELHDVVAHHVSVIGIQAGAARKVIDRDPAAATSALRTIEGSSRTAVGEMRQLLGVLRSGTDTVPDAPGASAVPGERRPEPGLAGLPDLARRHADNGLRVELRTVEGAAGDLARVPPGLGLSLYRCAQESLSNVLRHSTATAASVTLRTGAGPEGSWVELEVLDDGAPRPGTEGSGFGLQGLRERARLHGGTVETGPRPGRRGWRVRARCPLPAAGATDGSRPAAGAGLRGSGA